MGIGRLALGATVGDLMLGHGLQNLKGDAGGLGFDGHAEALGDPGLHPANHQALAAGLSESLGGGLTAFGLFSPLGPAMITGAMTVAIKREYQNNGAWASDGRFEYRLLQIAAAFASAVDGGTISIDRIGHQPRSGAGWGLFILLPGFGGAAKTLKVLERLNLSAQSGEVEPGSAAEDTNFPAE